MSGPYHKGEADTHRTTLYTIKCSPDRRARDAHADEVEMSRLDISSRVHVTVNSEQQYVIKLLPKARVRLDDDIHWLMAMPYSRIGVH